MGRLALVPSRRGYPVPLFPGSSGVFFKMAAAQQKLCVKSREGGGGGRWQGCGVLCEKDGLGWGVGAAVFGHLK